MTADKHTYAKAVKPSVPTDREVQIIDHLRTRDGKTILEDLATSLDQRESKIRRSIRSLEKRDVVSVNIGYTATWVDLNTPVAASLETRTSHRDHEKEANIATDGGYTQNVSLDTQTVYEMLRNERRRLVIFILAEHGRAYEGLGPYISVGDVAEIIVEASRGSPTRKAVYVALIQKHLSKLDDAGILSYDERGKNVRGKLPVYQLESIMLDIEKSIGNPEVNKAVTAEKLR
jgi:predicted transcriptional regulator